MEAIKSWIADAFARENEALTKALQISLSDGSSSSKSSSSVPSPLPPAAESESSNRPGIGRTGNLIPCLPSPKIAKRKMRSSKSSRTTYINADPAEFRRMVQEVTGIGFGEVRVPVDKRVRPELDRSGMGRVGQVLGSLLDRTVKACDTVGPVVDGPESRFEQFPCFPTLESWPYGECNN